MRADKALEENGKIRIKGCDREAILDGAQLRWLGCGSTHVAFELVLSTEWEPVPCDCAVCEAKRELKESHHVGHLAVEILINHAKCCKEG